MSVWVAQAGGGGLRERAPAAALRGLRDPGIPCTWVHGEADAEFIRALEEFGLSEVALISLREALPERPRVEEDVDHAYVSLFAVAAPSASTEKSIPPLRDLRAFVTSGWLITVGRLTKAELDTVFGRVDRQVFARGRGASFALFFFVEWAIETLYPVLDELDARVDSLEDLVVADGRSASMQTLFRLKRDLVELRRQVAPLRDVMQRLDSLTVSVIERGAEVYFRDLHDDVLRVLELIDTYREILSSALDLYLSTVNNRLNEIMKRLTVVATIFMPLTFLTGFFGMNFEHLPFHGWAWLVGSLVAMALIPIGMLLYFRRKEWW